MKTFTYTNPKDGKTHTKSMGFSWTAAIFGFWVPVIRGGEAALGWSLFGLGVLVNVFGRYMTAIDPRGAMFVPEMLVYIAVIVVVGINYNRWSYNAKVKKGWITETAE